MQVGVDKSQNSNADQGNIDDSFHFVVIANSDTPLQPVPAFGSALAPDGLIIG